MNNIENVTETLQEIKRLAERDMYKSQFYSSPQFAQDEIDACNLAISALEKQIELNDYLNTLRKNKKYQIYDILSEFALEIENE